MKISNKTKRVSYMELCKNESIILNNYIHSLIDDFELFSGTDYDEENDEYTEIYQEYIITESFAEYLRDFTDQIVYYSESANMYLWGITHYGTSWDYVYTDIKTIDYENN